MIAAKTVLSALCGAALLAAGPALSAVDQESSRDERVAMALTTAEQAARQAGSNIGPDTGRTALADALRVIERSGARPMPGWTGTDPVPGWRALIPGASGTVLRGSPLGPGYRSGQIRAGQSDTFQQVFLSGRKASIALSTVGGEPLSLRVIDAAHKPVCVADAQRRACRWVPIFTQRYMIEVRNGGQSQANYFLVVD